MPDMELTDLDAFVAVARRRSFRAAATLRGVSASTLSDAIRRLEARLGVRLLNRTTRSVTLTEPGLRLFERLTPALGEITAALDDVNRFRESPVGSLRLNVPGTVASLVLPPIMAGFLKTHPGISVEVMIEEGFVDVLAAGFDAGIRYDERLEQDMIAVPIGPRFQRFGLAASPAYLATRGKPEHPRDLLQHACLRHRFPSGAMVSWDLERNGEIVRIVPSGPMITSSIDLELRAAIDGLGIICSFEAWLEPALAIGSLQPLLEDWWPRFSGPFLYYPSRRHMPAPLRAFVDYLASSRG
jgi:DNA-binding transcriptional LysR family regulator